MREVADTVNRDTGELPLSSEELADRWMVNAKLIADLQAAQHHYGAELLRRMQALDATELPHPTLRVVLKQASPTYDISILVALKESLAEEELAKTYSPAHEKTVQVPERWSGSALNSLEKRLGGDVARMVQRARVPGSQHLSITAKETKE